MNTFYTFYDKDDLCVVHAEKRNGKFSRIIITCIITYPYSHINWLQTKTLRKYSTHLPWSSAWYLPGTSGTQLLIQLCSSAILNEPFMISWLCGRSWSKWWIRICNDNGRIWYSCNCDTFGWMFGVMNVCNVPYWPSMVRNLKSKRFTSTWHRYVASKWLPAYGYEHTI